MRIISISEMKIWAPHSLHEMWDSLYIYWTHVMCLLCIVHILVFCIFIHLIIFNSFFNMSILFVNNIFYSHVIDEC